LHYYVFDFVILKITVIIMNQIVIWKPLCTYEKNVKHPSTIYESRNLSLAKGPDITYQESDDLNNVHKDEKISTFQFETVRLICQCLSHRKSFFLGDGTGCGKGRMIASTALEFIQNKQKVMWVSVNKRLYQDAIRDTAVLESSKLKWDKFNGCLSFVTYMECMNENTRNQVVAWLEESTHPLIILDECHWLRHSSKSSRSMDELLKLLPHCKILYSSATAASAPSHFKYTDDLGLWGSGAPFRSFEDFISALTKHGNNIMELVALHMKSHGVYVSRHLSMDDVDITYVKQGLSTNVRHLYNRCAREFANNNFLGGIKHQIFWQRFLAHTKIPIVIELIKDALKDGKAVIVALQNTGEASDVRNIIPNAPEYVSTCEEIFKEVTTNAIIPDFGLDPIDAIIQEFGTDNVAEITGRKKRVDIVNGKLSYVAKPSTLKECINFQTGKKDIAILSRAGSTGISLHAENANSKARVHICMELPWSAEDFLQQCGRSHRSSSTKLPIYKFVYTEIPAELRFVSSISHKLSNMGSLTKADRNSSSHFIESQDTWSTAAKREVSIRICYDYMMNRIKSITPTVQVPTIYTNEVYNLLECKLDTPLNSKKIKLLKLISETLQDNSIDVDADKYLKVISIVQFIVPHHRTWNTGKFIPQFSYLYPKKIKNTLVSLLLLRKTWECRNTFGALPDPIFDIIYNMVSCMVHVDTSNLYDSMHFIGFDKLPTMTNYSIQNKLLGLQIEDQTMFESIMLQAVENNCTNKRKILNLDDLYSKIINESSFEIKKKLLQTSPDYVLDVWSELPTYPQFPAADTVLNVVTNQVYRFKYEDNLVFIYTPCSKNPCRRFIRNQWDQEFAEGRFQKCDGMIFERKEAQRLRHLNQKIRVCKYRYFIGLHGALERWEQSKKTLVTFDTQSGSTVGLLLNVVRL